MNRKISSLFGGKNRVAHEYLWRSKNISEMDAENNLESPEQEIELLEDDFVEVVDLDGDDEAEEGTTVISTKTLQSLENLCHTCFASMSV